MGRISVVLEISPLLLSPQPHFYCTEENILTAYPSLNLQGLTRYVRRPAGGMPAFTEKILSDRELTDIYAYLKSLPQAKAPKDIPLLEQIRDR